MKQLMMAHSKDGDVILVDFNPVRGSEIAKIRPCIVVSNEVLNKYSPLYIVIPLTTNIKRVLPFHLLVKKSQKNGLSADSKAVTEHIKSIDKSRFVKKLGALESIFLEKLEKKIAFVIKAG